MKQLDLVPGIVQNAAVDYVYPVGVSFLFLAIGTLVGSLMVGKIYKADGNRFKDIIEVLRQVNRRLRKVLAGFFTDRRARTNEKQRSRRQAEGKDNTDRGRRTKRDGERKGNRGRRPGGKPPSPWTSEKRK